MTGVSRDTGGDLDYDPEIAARDAAEKKAELFALQELEDLRRMLATYSGRWFVWRLLTFCGVYETSFDVNPLVMSLQEGKRTVGLWALDKIDEAVPGIYVQMKTEALQRKKETD